MQTPARKSGTFEMHDTASLIKFVQKHKKEGTQIYIDADFKSGKIAVKAAINGHTAADADWFDFTAIYQPRHTAAAENWLKYNIEKMNQAQFAHFLTNNARNIVSKNPANDAAVYPTAAEVLDFALNLEYTEKTTFKQGYREQDGRINFTFQSEDAGQTEKQLKMFERCGALVLWYELQQIDAVIEQAAQDIATSLQTAFADIDIYFGAISNL